MSKLVRRSGKKRQLQDGERTLLGVGLLALLLGIIGAGLFVAKISVVSPY